MSNFTRLFFFCCINIQGFLCNFLFLFRSLQFLRNRISRRFRSLDLINFCLVSNDLSGLFFCIFKPFSVFINFNCNLSFLMMHFWDNLMIRNCFFWIWINYIWFFAISSHFKSLRSSFLSLASMRPLLEVVWLCIEVFVTVITSVLCSFGEQKWICVEWNRLNHVDRKKMMQRLFVKHLLLHLFRNRLKDIFIWFKCSQKILAWNLNSLKMLISSN